MMVRSTGSVVSLLKMLNLEFLFIYDVLCQMMLLSMLITATLGNVPHVYYICNIYYVLCFGVLHIHM